MIDVKKVVRNDEFEGTHTDFYIKNVPYSLDKHIDDLMEFLIHFEELDNEPRDRCYECGDDPYYEHLFDYLSTLDIIFDSFKRSKREYW